MSFGQEKPIATWIGYDTVYPPGSGPYADPRAWNTGKVPDEGYHAVLPANTHPYTVSHGVQTPSVYELTIGKGATLASTASLKVDDYTQVDGTLSMRAAFSTQFLYGSGMVTGYGVITSYIGAAVTGAGIVPTSLGFAAVGGTLEFDSLPNFRSHVGGLLSGTGTVDLHSGAFVFDPGTRATVSNLTISGAQVWLGQNLTYGGHFTLAGGSLSLVDGSTFRTGSLSLNGANTFGTGTVLGEGTDASHDPALSLRGPTALVGGTTFQDTLVKNYGKLSAFGSMTLSDSTFANGKGSIYEHV